MTSSAQHTALVLADENLLIPVLYAIPETITNLNITMGYPIMGSVVFSLVDSLYELEKTSAQEPAGVPVYYFTGCFVDPWQSVVKIHLRISCSKGQTTNHKKQPGLPGRERGTGGQKRGYSLLFWEWKKAMPVITWRMFLSF